MDTGTSLSWDRSSQWAAEASECAGDQDAFWQYHDLLLIANPVKIRGVTKTRLKKFAADLKLDTKAFDECLDTGKYTNLVQSETTQAQSLGVRSTPAFVVNGQPLVGAQPYEMFKQVIEQQLAGKQ